MIAVAGCGSTTKQDVIARANALCATAQRDIRALAPPSGSSMGELATYLGTVIPVVDREASGMRALPRPKPGRAVLDSWIASVELAAADFRAWRSAAQLGDREAIETAVGALRASDEGELADRYGARVCAASTGTVAGPR